MLITLTTDFGLLDFYVGAMKGVVATLSPNTQVIDISHQVPAHDVAAGGFILAGACETFPEGSIHVGVIDPGVGGGRRGIVVETNRYRFVGPDNGLLSPILERGRVERVVSIENPDLALEVVSSTFHGRDVFAPAAAHLANGVPLADLGPEVTDPEQLDLWQITETQSELVGHVVHVDRFGNAITNLSRARVETAGRGRPYQVEVDSHWFLRLHETYSEVAVGQPCMVMGSLDTLELSVNSGSAAERFGFRRGSVAMVRWE